MDIKNKDEFKNHITKIYRVTQKHIELLPNYNLELFIDGYHALYKRSGRYMYLVDTFSSYEEANQQAKDILDAHQKLKKNINI